MRPRSLELIEEESLDAGRGIGWMSKTRGRNRYS